MNRTTEVREAVVDTNILIDYLGESGGSLTRALNTISEEYKIKSIVVLDSVYSEIEKLKKGNGLKDEDLVKKARMVYSKLGKILDDPNNKYIRYEDVPRHERGVDDSLIDYCIENDKVFVSFDTRANLRYNFKKGKQSNFKVTRNQLSKVISLHKSLDEVSTVNLYKYLEEMLDSKKIDLIDYAVLDEVSKFEVLVDYLIEKELEGESEDFICHIKRSMVEEKEGKIPTNLFKGCMMKLRKYNLGHIKIESEPLRKRFGDAIARFLQEKGFEDFEELIKCQPFKREEELVEGILRYYGIEKERN